MLKSQFKVYHLMINQHFIALRISHFCYLKMFNGIKLEACGSYTQIRNIFAKHEYTLSSLTNWNRQKQIIEKGNNGLKTFF